MSSVAGRTVKDRAVLGRTRRRKHEMRLMVKVKGAGPHAFLEGPGPCASHRNHLNGCHRVLAGCRFPGHAVLSTVVWVANYRRSLWRSCPACAYGMGSSPRIIGGTQEASETPDDKARDANRAMPCPGALRPRLATTRRSVSCGGGNTCDECALETHLICHPPLARCCCHRPGRVLPRIARSLTVLSAAEDITILSSHCRG